MPMMPNIQSAKPFKNQGLTFGGGRGGVYMSRVCKPKQALNRWAPAAVRRTPDHHISCYLSMGYGSYWGRTASRVNGCRPAYTTHL